MYISFISIPVPFEIIVSSATWVFFKVFVFRDSAIFQQVEHFVFGDSAIFQKFVCSDLLASFFPFSVRFS